MLEEFTALPEDHLGRVYDAVSVSPTKGVVHGLLLLGVAGLRVQLLEARRILLLFR